MPVTTLIRSIPSSHPAPPQARGGAGPQAAAPAPPVPITALNDIAAGLAYVQRSVPSTGEDPAAPRSIRLIATPDYDVWLITWPPGSRLGDHDHAAATSVTRMVSGVLVEEVGPPGPANGSRRMLAPGLSVVTPPYAPHRIHNASGSDATSLHVYSPPLAAVTYLDPGPGRSLHPARGAPLPREIPIRHHAAEATTKAALRPVRALRNAAPGRQRTPAGTGRP